MPSTVLYSTRPVSAVLASIPSDSVAAYARSSSRPSSARAGAEEQPLVRDHRVPRPGPEPRVAGHHVDGPAAGAAPRTRPRPARASRRPRRPASPPPPPAGCAVGPPPRSRRPAAAPRRVDRPRPAPTPCRRGVPARRRSVPRTRGPRPRSDPGWPPRGGARPATTAPRAPSPGRRSRYAPSTTAPSATASTCGVGPSARRSPCASRQVQAADSSSRTGPPATSRCTTATQERPWQHGQLPFDHHRADPPPPPGQPVDQVEALQQLVTARVHDAGGPLVRAERAPARRTAA